MRTANVSIESRARTSNSWKSLFTFFLAGAGTALATVIAWSLLEWRSLRVPLPFEDAAMLFRYAESLANGGGLAWNFGEPPSLTDGATDLGFVLVLTPLIVLGLNSTVAALAINLTSVALIGGLLALASKLIWRFPLSVAILISFFAVSGPIHRYVLSGFSPPTLATLLLVVVVAACMSIRSYGFAWMWALAAGLAAGLAGWWRPEGFAFGGLLLLLAFSIGNYRSPRRAFTLLLIAIAPLVGLALTWIGFRLIYFGQLLPTSAVMKGGGLNIGNVLPSFQFLVTALLPAVALILVIGLFSTKWAWPAAATILAASLVWINGAIPAFWWDRLGFPAVTDWSDLMTQVLLVPVLIAVFVISLWRRSRLWIICLALVIFPAMWISVETTLNWWMRMQWPIVPALGALVLTAIFPKYQDSVRLSLAGAWRRWSVAGLVAVPVILFHLPWSGYSEFPFHSSVYRALQGLDTSDLRIVSTEAGLIPLAVQGPALDPWGHNNRAIAENGLSALDQELANFLPNVIVTHGRTPAEVASQACKEIPGGTSFGPFAASWLDMDATLREYANSNDFVLLRSTETDPCEAWSIFVDSTVSEQVRLALSDYRFPGKDLV